jgi:hypothetical protein
MKTHAHHAITKTKTPPHPAMSSADSMTIKPSDGRALKTFKKLVNMVGLKCAYRVFFFLFKPWTFISLGLVLGFIFLGGGVFFWDDTKNWIRVDDLVVGLLILPYGFLAALRLQISNQRYMDRNSIYTDATASNMVYRKLFIGALDAKLRPFLDPATLQVLTTLTDKERATVGRIDNVKGRIHSFFDATDSFLTDETAPVLPSRVFYQLGELTVDFYQIQEQTSLTDMLSNAMVMNVLGGEKIPYLNVPFVFDMLLLILHAIFNISVVFVIRGRHLVLEDWEQAVSAALIVGAFSAILFVIMYTKENNPPLTSRFSPERNPDDDKITKDTIYSVYHANNEREKGKENLNEMLETFVSDMLDPKKALQHAGGAVTSLIQSRTRGQHSY